MRLIVLNYDPSLNKKLLVITLVYFSNVYRREINDFDDGYATWGHQFQHRLEMVSWTQLNYFTHKYRLFYNHCMVKLLIIRLEHGMANVFLQDFPLSAILFLNN